jgi:predicted phosphate transport protein (TIGR00153 family)
MGLKELLLPQEARFFDLLERQASFMVKGAEALVEGLERWDNPVEIRRRLKDIEHEGDKVVHDIYEALNQTFITPIDREDISALASSLDDVLDFTYATVNHMVLYDIQKVPLPLLDVARLLKEQTVHLRAGVAGLRDLKDRSALERARVEVNRLENAADDATNKAIADLFRPAEGKDPFFVMKMKDIYNYIETATDKAEDCADVIGDIAVKHG